MKNTKKGFTLVELLVVIAILAILASVAVVGYTAFLDKARLSNAETEANQIQMSADSFHMVGDDFVLGTYEVVTTPDDPDTEANEKVATVYTVYLAADDNKVYAVKDEKGATPALVTAVPSGMVWSDDLKDLPGELNITANSVLTYLGKDLTAKDTIEIK